MEKIGNKGTQNYWDKFDQADWAAKNSPSVYSLRKAAMGRFAELGFPTVQMEDWRFTNVAPIAALPFNPTAEQKPVKVAPLLPDTFNTIKSSRLVFVDGKYAPAHSHILPQVEGVKISNLASALKTDAVLVEKYLGRHAQTSDNAFIALNTAFFQDGAFIYVPAGKVILDPVNIVFVATGAETGATTSLRNLIVAEKSSQFTVIESFTGSGANAYFTNVVEEFVIGENAVVEHCKFQDETPVAYHVSAIHAQLGKNCNFVAHSITTGSKLSRNNIRTHLAEEGIECVLNGLYLTRNEQLADNYMIVDHAKPHCNSHEYYNGILGDRSKGVFHGRILVRQDAQKTDAKQTNKNLLLSDDATIDTKPQLEIYADDVKCTHGATIGQLNDDSIFYLRARGIGAETARRMLIHAFAGEIIDRIRCTAVREEMDKIVWDRLEQSSLIGK